MYFESGLLCLKLSKANKRLGRWASVYVVLVNVVEMNQRFSCSKNMQIGQHISFGSGLIAFDRYQLLPLLKGNETKDEA